MKNLVLTPEFILENFHHTLRCDGNGNVSIYAEGRDVDWNYWCLNLCGISYIAEEAIGQLSTEFNFKIADLKEECPFLYNKWTALDKSQAKYIKGRKKAGIM